MISRQPFRPKLAGGQDERVHLAADCLLFVLEQSGYLPQRQVIILRDDHHVHVTGVVVSAAAKRSEDECGSELRRERL